MANWGGAAGGAASGAALGSQIMPGWGTAIGAVAGGVMGLFGGKKKKDESSSGGGYQMSPEQQQLLNNQLAYSNGGVQAMGDLQKFYQTGNWFDMYQAGEGYGDQLGAYQMTPIEQNSQLSLNNMIQSGAPELNRLAWDEYKNLLTTDQYNPMAENKKGTHFDPYYKQIMKSQTEQQDLLNRSLAAGGDFYSTNRYDQTRQLGENTQDQTNLLISDLYKNYEEQRLSGARTAADLGAQQQNMQMQQIEAGHQYGALQRTLDDQKAKEAYNDWLRQRSEYGDLINTAKSIYSGGLGATGGNAAASNPYAYDLMASRYAAQDQQNSLGTQLLSQLGRQGTQYIGNYVNNKYGGGIQ